MTLNTAHPKFVVLLAAYNGEKFIDQQIASILDQKYVDLHLYISIDPSADGTEIGIQRLAGVDSRITLLSSGGRFGGAAKNFYRLIKDVDFSSYDFISFSDQDDIWFPEKLSRAYVKLSQENVDAYSSNVIAFWPNGDTSLIRKSHRQVKWDFLFEAAGPGCTYVIKKKLILDFQNLLKARWDEAQNIGLHDWFIYAFARAKNYKWIIDESPSMLYRQHENNQVGVNKGFKAFRYRLNKIFNGWAFGQTSLIADLVADKVDPSKYLHLNGSRLGYLKLTLLATQCRRRLRDQIFFAFSCLLMCLIGGKGK
jgi:rhamnosyltransferase